MKRKKKELELELRKEKEEKKEREIENADLLRHGTKHFHHIKERGGKQELLGSFAGID